MNIYSEQDLLMNQWKHGMLSTQQNRMLISLVNISISKSNQSKNYWNLVGSSLTVTSDPFLEFVNREFLVRDKSKVEILLKNNSYLNGLVMCIYRRLKEYFPDSQLIMSIFEDPENESRDEKILIEIKSNLNIAEALDRLELFDNSWWLYYVRDTKGKIIINLGY